MVTALYSLIEDPGQIKQLNWKTKETELGRNLNSWLRLGTAGPTTLWRQGKKTYQIGLYAMQV